MSWFPTAKHVNDGASGSNGLSVVSAKGNLYKPSGGLYGSLRNLFTTPEQRNMEDAYTNVVTDNYNENIEDGMDSEDAIADATGLGNILDPGSPFSGSGKVQAKPITYSDWSDAARYFGMNQATAYAEHMANTAHQREVADLRAAGLNPVLGVGSGASGVTGHVAYSGGASSGRKLSDDSVLVDTIGATVGFLTSLLVGDTAGRYASKAASGLGKLLEKK